MATGFGVSSTAWGLTGCSRAAASEDSAAESLARAWLSAATNAAVSGRGAIDGAVGPACRTCCGARINATNAAMKAPTPTAAITTGRRTAFRARAVNHAGREIPRGRSVVKGVMGSSLARLRPLEQRLGACRKKAEPGKAPLRTQLDHGTYWTVTLPFMPIARCGVQWNSYFPGFTPPNEITYSSFGFMSVGLESSESLLSMLASSCALESAGTAAGSNETLCGPPLTMTNFTASPALIVMSAGSNR